MDRMTAVHTLARNGIQYLISTAPEVTDERAALPDDVRLDIYNALTAMIGPDIEQAQIDEAFECLERT